MFLLFLQVVGGVSQAETTNFIVGCSVIALVWALWNFWIISGTKIGEGVSADEEKASLNTHSTARSIRLLKEVTLLAWCHDPAPSYPSPTRDGRSTFLLYLTSYLTVQSIHPPRPGSRGHRDGRRRLPARRVRLVHRLRGGLRSRHLLTHFVGPEQVRLDEMSCSQLPGAPTCLTHYIYTIQHRGCPHHPGLRPRRPHEHPVRLHRHEGGNALYISLL